MGLYHFHSAIYQFLIAGRDFTDAVVKFQESLRYIYGSTLRNCQPSNDHNAVTVWWQEEGNSRVEKDVYHVKVLPEEAADFFNSHFPASPKLISKTRFMR